jgi:ferritin-like protein
VSRKKKADHPEQSGSNLTGTQSAPIQSVRTEEGAKAAGPDPAGSPRDFLTAHAEVWMRYASDLEPVGTMPPPGSRGGLAKSALDMVSGTNEQVLLDKLGERLAFERTGTRLYELMGMKLDMRGSWTGGPSRQDLLEIRNDEHDHFQLLVEAILDLGGDPTAMTPGADIVAMESQGLQNVVADPRTTPAQALHAIMSAELVDGAGWELLIQLAQASGREPLAARFRQVSVHEEEHLRKVRRWLRNHMKVESGFDLEATPPPV